VRAVGTQFDVYRREGRTTITVVEGRVLAVHDATPAIWQTVAHAAPELPAASSPGTSIQNANDAILVSAGEQLTFSPTAAPRPRLADVESATAWTQGRLIFEATPLPEVAQEFNRYNERKIVVEDGALAGFLVNGSFGSSDPSSLVRFLREQPTLSIHETAHQIRISRR
jgi:transmembrane sensor